MLPAVLICAAACVFMIVCVLFVPSVKIGKLRFAPYWVVTLLFAVLLLAGGWADAADVGKALVADTAVNPLKILALFLAMTFLSVFLDELGFFRFLASAALRHAHRGQMRLFVSLYAVVSVLTVFTSNDVIILSFTPFICYFAKNAKISPMPYLAAEFVAANTWSMMLVIGNPTNIYLATAFGVTFPEYLKVSALPTLAAGGVAFAALFLLYRKKLAAPIGGAPEPVPLNDKPLLAVGVAHLAVCTVLLAVGSYLGIEMWLVAVCAAGSLVLSSLAVCAVRRERPAALWGAVKRIPYPLVPFVLSMFVLIEGLAEHGATAALYDLFRNGYPVFTYGAASFFASNLINNIPMSVLFAAILRTGETCLPAVYASIVGSNLGAFFTPVGALAGIMWSSIANAHGVRLRFPDFLKMGVFVALPTLAVSLLVLWAVV